MSVTVDVDAGGSVTVDVDENAGGPAGGVLSGNYPDPGFAVPMATEAELTAHKAAHPAHLASGVSVASGAGVTATDVQAAIAQIVGFITSQEAGDSAAIAAVAASVGDETTRATAQELLKLAKAANLSDLANAATARTNLGLGTAATHPATDFDAAGAAAAAQAASQPLDSDLTAIAALTTTVFGRALLALADAAAGRTALGLGSAATQPSSAFDPAGAATAAAAALVNSSPATLDTLKELADALGDDPNFATTTATALGTKVDTAGVGLVKSGTTMRRAASTTGYANLAALPTASAHTGEQIRTTDGGIYESDGASWLVIRDPTGTYASEPASVESRKLGVRMGKTLDRFVESGTWVAGTNSTLTKVTTDYRYAAYQQQAITSGTNGATGLTGQASRDLYFSMLNTRYGRFLSVKFRPDNNFFSMQVHLVVGSAKTYATARFDSQPRFALDMALNDWNTLIFPAAEFDAAGSSPPAVSLLGDVREIWIDVTAKTATATNGQYADLRIHDYSLPPGIIWRFDDARQNTHDVVWPIMAAQGTKGMIAAPTGILGTTLAGSPPVDIMSLPNLQAMYADGWGVCSHTHNHVDLSAASGAVQISEAQQSIGFLRDNGMTGNEHHLVYPTGAFNDTVVKEELRRFRTGITTRNRYAVGDTVEGYGRIGTFYVTEPTSLASVEAAMDRLVARGGINMFTFHSQLVSPTSGGSDWYVDRFTAAVAYAKSRGLASYLMSDLWSADVYAYGQSGF